MDSPKIGWSVLIVRSPMMRFITSLMFQFFSPTTNMHVVPSLEDALTFLRQRDPSLSKAQALDLSVSRV